MTMIVKNLADFINLVAQAFNLSAIFPALIFVLLTQMFVLPLLPADSPARVLLLAEGNNVAVGINIALVALLAYLLDAANRALIRLFEGYPLKRLFPFDLIRKYHQERAEQALRRIDEIEAEIGTLVERIERETDPDRKRELEQQLQERDAILDRLKDWFYGRYPEDLEDILPMPMGNVIAAAEYYPFKILGMDSIVLWPFLRPIIVAKEYAHFVIRDKAVLDFLVNITTVLAAFGVLYGGVEWFFRGLNPVLILELSLVGLSCCLTYALSVKAAASWGSHRTHSFCDLPQRPARTPVSAPGTWLRR